MLPTTIKIDGKPVVLHPKAYPGLNWAESTMLARLAVLTQNGAKPCVYTTKAAMQEFGVSEKTARRILKQLQTHGYISSAIVSSLTFGPNVRQITVDSVKLNQTIEGQDDPTVIAPPAATTAPASPVSTPRPTIAFPAQTAPKELKRDIASALASPLAGSQPAMLPPDWEDQRARLWAETWELCEQSNDLAYQTMCLTISRPITFAFDVHCANCITPEHPEGVELTPQFRQLVTDTEAAIKKCDFLTILAAKLKNHHFCSEQEYRTAAYGCFAYCFTAKFLREHKDCPPESAGTFCDQLHQSARDYATACLAWAQDGSTDLAQRLMTDLEPPEQLRLDSRWPEFVAQHLAPMVKSEHFIHFIRPQLTALDEPLSLDVLSAHKGPLRHKRELITYAPAKGVDPRGLPCYQPFTNTTVFDLGPALDQTKFGRFTCFDVNGAQHDFKFDFTALDELLSSRYVDKVTTFDLPKYDPRYTTCFKGHPCLAKAIHDYILFAIVTELIAPITPEQVFYNMQEHQDSDLLELFQDQMTHKSLLMFICDRIYPDLTPDAESFNSRPLFNAIQRTYCAGSKSMIEYAATKVAWEVVRLLGDPKTSAKVFTAVGMELMEQSRGPWLTNLTSGTPTKLRGFYHLCLSRMLIADGNAGFIPRLTYPYLLMRKLFGIHALGPNEQYQVGRTLCLMLDIDPFAARDLSVVKATYAADYPFLAQMEVYHD